MRNCVTALALLCGTVCYIALNFYTMLNKLRESLRYVTLPIAGNRA